MVFTDSGSNQPRCPLEEFPPITLPRSAPARPVAGSRTTPKGRIPLDLPLAEFARYEGIGLALMALPRPLGGCLLSTLEDMHEVEDTGVVYGRGPPRKSVPVGGGFCLKRPTTRNRSQPRRPPLGHLAAGQFNDVTLTYVDQESTSTNWQCPPLMPRPWTVSGRSAQSVGSIHQTLLDNRAASRTGRSSVYTCDGYQVCARA